VVPLTQTRNGHFIFTILVSLSTAKDIAVLVRDDHGVTRLTLSGNGHFVAVGEDIRYVNVVSMVTM